MGQPLSVAANVSASNVTVALETEVTVIASPALPSVRQNATFLILAWAQVTTGASTTTLTGRIRRTNLVGGTLVNEANAEQVKAAAGSTEFLFAMAIDQQAPADNIRYNFSVQGAGSAADNTALQAGIVVFLLS